MRAPKFGARWLTIWGLIVVGMGLLDTAQDYYLRLVLSYPLNMGIIVGNTAIVVIGATTLIIAGCLGNLEKRVDKIDNAKASGTHSKDDCPMTEQEEVPWEGQCAAAAYDFALRCAVLAKQNPYNLAAPLADIINTLMTELWDRNFSQSEIRNAFEEAIKDMPRYAGRERRSATFAGLFTSELPTKEKP
jgi:hypothetical protein